MVTFAFFVEHSDGMCLSQSCYDTYDPELRVQREQPIFSDAHIFRKQETLPSTWYHSAAF